jgi:hypothetical protein
VNRQGAGTACYAARARFGRGVRVLRLPPSHRETASCPAARGRCLAPLEVSADENHRAFARADPRSARGAEGSAGYGLLHTTAGEPVRQGQPEVPSAGRAGASGGLHEPESAGDGSEPVASVGRRPPGR